MQTYNVHVYREMRLFFPGIVARTAEEAATLAAEMPSGVAEALEDCDGENLAALVGVVDSADCQQSWMIDLNTIRIIVPDLLTALELALPILQEAARTHLLSDDLAERMALDRVASAISKAHVQTT
jgi:Rad3-related DNA helicase